MMARSHRSTTIEPRTASEPGLLSSQLRSATGQLHQAAERAPLMAALLRGELDHAGYVALLTQLLSLYQALEEGLDRHAALPEIAGFDFAALRRVPALLSDLQTMGAPPAPLQPAARQYRQRLQALAGHDPLLLIAHAHVRYLGDLHGGQLLRRALGKGVLALPPTATRFHDFGTADDVAAAIRRFRTALDALALDGPRRQQLVDEACWSFEQHRKLFDELAGYLSAEPRMRR